MDMDRAREPEGCLAQVWPTFAAILTLSLISRFFGLSASMWFAGGFLVAVVAVLWETGHNAKKCRQYSLDSGFGVILSAEQVARDMEVNGG